MQSSICKIVHRIVTEVHSLVPMFCSQNPQRGEGSSESIFLASGTQNVIDVILFASTLGRNQEVIIGGFAALKLFVVAVVMNGALMFCNITAGVI